MTYKITEFLILFNVFQTVFHFICILLNGEPQDGTKTQKLKFCL